MTIHLSRSHRLLIGGVVALTLTLAVVGAFGLTKGLAGLVGLGFTMSAILLVWGVE